MKKFLPYLMVVGFVLLGASTPVLADGVGKIIAVVNQMFAGNVNGAGATTGQALVKQASGEWKPGSSVTSSAWSTVLGNGASTAGHNPIVTTGDGIGVGTGATVYAGSISWGTQQANAQNSSALIGPSTGNFNVTLGDANSDFEVHSGVGDVTYTEGLFRMSGKTDGLSILINAGSLTGPYGSEIILNGGDGTTGGSFTVYTSPALSTFPARFYIDNLGNVVLNKSGSAIATTTSNGFTYLPTCAGTPTGVPTAFTGAAPLVVDSTNNILYFRSGGSWQKAGTTFPLLAPDGTVSAPSYSFTNSATSGMWSPGVGSIAFSSNNLEALRLDTANDVTISQAASRLIWLGRATIRSNGDGILTIQNNAGTDFSRLCLGNTTSSFPSIKRSGSGLSFRLADDSADAAITAASSSLSATSNQLVLHSASNAGTLTWVPTAARTLTLPDVTSTVMTTGGGQTITSGLWNGTVISTVYGGTGIDTSAVTNGQLLIGNTTGNVWARATLTGTTNQVVVTNAASSITLSLPQSIGTASTPTFGGIVLNGKATTYNLVTTAAWGIPAIYGSGRATAQTAANTSVSTYTVGAADGTFTIHTNLNVTASTTFNINVQVTYTDESNNAQTLTLNFQNAAGTILTAITNVQGVGPYEGLATTIRCKASTAITVKTAGTFTTVTYNVEGHIVQIA